MNVENNNPFAKFAERSDAEWLNFVVRLEFRQEGEGVWQVVFVVRKRSE